MVQFSERSDHLWGICVDAQFENFSRVVIALSLKTQ